MRRQYLEFFGHLPDFEITYSIYSKEEGGRDYLPFQGIRWDFIYEDYPDEGFMIYPEFLAKDGTVFQQEAEPVLQHGKATMWILSKKLRPLHQARIKPGTRGYFLEGPKRVGVCEVTRLIDLMINPIA